MKRKFKISWDMMFMLLSSEFLLIISFSLINHNDTLLSQAGYYFLIPSMMFGIVTMMYWTEVFSIGEEQLKKQLKYSGFKW